MTVGAVALLAGSIAVGTTVQSPRTSDPYVALAGEQAATQSERNSIKSNYDSVKAADEMELANRGVQLLLGIYRIGTNGGDTIENDNPQGHPVVNLAAGQDLNSTRCGTWGKQ